MVNRERIYPLLAAECFFYVIYKIYGRSSILYFIFLQFIYVNQSFAPSPDQEVGTLYEVIFVLNILSKCAYQNLSVRFWQLNSLTAPNYAGNILH